MPDINSKPKVTITLDVARRQIQLKNAQILTLNITNNMMDFIFLGNPIVQHYPIHASYNGSMKIETKYEIWDELSNYQKEKGCFPVVHVTSPLHELTLYRLTFTSLPFLVIKPASENEESLLTANVTFTAEEIIFHDSEPRD